MLQPNSEKGMVKTGLISLATVPANANLYIENKRYLKKTPMIIRDLIPGSYTLSLALKDYNPLSRQILVEAGHAAAFERTVLLPKRWNPQVLVADNFESIIPVGGTHFFVLTKGSRLKDYLAYNWKKGLARPLLEPESQFKSAKVLSYFLVKGSNFIFMHIVLNNREMFIRIEIKERAAKVDELSRFFYKLPLNIKWDAQDPGNIFILEEDHLNRLDISTESLSPRYLENVKGYVVLDRMLYLFTQDNAVIRLDYEKKKSEVLYDNSRKDTIAYNTQKSFNLEPLSREEAIFCPELGELFLNRASHRVVENNLEGADFDAESRRLVVWQKDKLGILEFKKEKIDEDARQDLPQLVWVFSGARSITQCFWVYKGTHLVFLDENKVYMLGIEGELNPGANLLFEVKLNSDIFYNEETHSLYYLDRASGNLSCVQIII